MTDVGLAQLKGLPTLKVLGLRGTGVTDAGLVHLEHLPQIRYWRWGGHASRTPGSCTYGVWPISKSFGWRRLG